MRSGRTLVSLLVSGVAVAAFVVWALGQPSPTWPSDTQSLLELGGSLLTFAVATLIRAARWRALAAGAGVTLERGEAAWLTVTGYALNNVLPARAGDVYRTVCVARASHVPLATAAGTVVAERVLDAVALMLFLLVALVLGPSGAHLPEGLNGLAVAGVIVAAAIAVLAVAYASTTIRRFAGTLLTTLGRIGARRALAGVCLSLVIWGLEVLVYVAAAKAVSAPLDVLGACYVVAIANFVGILPAAPSAIGTYDAAVVFAARALGVAGGVAVAYLLALRTVLFIPITLLGVVLLLVRGGGWRAVRAVRAEGGEAL